MLVRVNKEGKRERKVGAISTAIALVDSSLLPQTNHLVYIFYFFFQIKNPSNIVFISF